MRGWGSERSGKEVDESMEVGGMLEGRVSSEGSEKVGELDEGRERREGEGGRGRRWGDGGVRGGGKGRRWEKGDEGVKVVASVYKFVGKCVLC